MSTELCYKGVERGEVYLNQSRHDFASKAWIHCNNRSGECGATNNKVHHHMIRNGECPVAQSQRGLCPAQLSLQWELIIIQHDNLEMKMNLLLLLSCKIIQKETK